MPAADAAILTAALEYAGLGWRVVPLYPKKKNPRIEEWQKGATSDSEKVAEWFSRWPDSNVGVQMGERSGIIDIECDSAAAESSLAALFGGSFPDTPTFKAKRGKHRLFKWRGDLPGAEKATHKIGEIDFKFGGGEKGSQSVFPPSIHPDGGKYEWLIHPNRSEVAPIDDATAARLWNHEGGSFVEKKTANPESPRQNLYKNDQIPEGQRDNTLYAECCNIWREKSIVYGAAALDSPETHGQVFRTLRAWNLAACWPPLSEDEVHQKVESARKFIAQSMDSDTEKRGRKLTAWGLEWREGEWWPGKWSVDLIETDPPATRLNVPFHKKAIELSMEQYNSHHLVHLAVLAETGTVCLDDRPGFWSAIWNGTKGSVKDGRPATRGLKAKLLDGAKRIAGPTELKHRNVVAEFAWNWVAGAVQQGAEPTRKTKLFRDEEGNIFFRFTAMYQDVQFQNRDFTRNDLSKAVRTAGAREVLLGSPRTQFMLLDTESQTRLRDMATGAFDWNSCASEQAYI